MHISMKCLFTNWCLILRSHIEERSRYFQIIVEYCGHGFEHVYVQLVVFSFHFLLVSFLICYIDTVILIICYTLEVISMCNINNIPTFEYN